MPLGGHARFWAALAVFAAPIASPASAATARIDIRQMPMEAALAALVQATEAELLFDRTLVQGLTASPIRGRLSTEAALARLLADSGVGFRVTSTGAFVLFAIVLGPAAGADDGAVSELLVVGRRTQNADIRRTENDIQPYKVAGPRALAAAPHDSLDQFLRTRLPANAQQTAPSQNVLIGAGTNSAIDLRGVGNQRTLVLIDGRRLPGLPTEGAGVDQGDLNGMPLGAIERIETLTSTAGGIHGPGAIGGVVNVVLRRDYRGADLTLVSGLSARGDAGRVRVEARVGFTPDHGATDVMLFASYSAAQPFHTGQRDYAQRSLRRQAANDPASFLLRSDGLGAVVVRSSSGAPLRLDPAFGGAVLSASYSFLPLDFTGGEAERAAALLANSGVIPARQAPGRAGATASLLSTPRTASLLFNVRRRLSSRLELFADGLYLSNRGRAYTAGLTTVTTTQASAASNPFTDAVIFRYPTPDLFTVKESNTEARRLTAGAIARLPWGWQASADYTIGRTVLETSSDGGRTDFRFNDALTTGLPGAVGLPVLSPLGDFAIFRNAVSAYGFQSILDTRLINNFSNAALRAAGPVVSLPAGPLTLTLLGEVRREHMPVIDRLVVNNGSRSAQATADRIQAVRSAYVELRAPLVARESRFIPARGLELQLALRHDDLRTAFPANVLAPAPGGEDLTTVRHRANVYTVGGRVLPASWLMLRGSFATGKTPPDLRHLQERAFPATMDVPSEPTDPKRGGRRVTQDGSYLWVRNGFHGIGQEKGRTLTAGVVLNPSGRGGPRLSADVSRVEVRDEIVAFTLSLQQLLDAESLYPGRVVREPLSAADAALGYAAGRVTALHAGLINGGRTTLEAVDFQLDWTLIQTSRGQARLYGAATWQPSMRTRTGEAAAWVERIGYRDGPLEWRGNLGVEWMRGPLTIDLNLQYFDGRRVASAGTDAFLQSMNASRIRYQGRSAIPAQAYLDLVARRRFELPAGGAVSALDVRLAVQNLLDHSPPIVADPFAPYGLGYDYYGDPRRRRVELLLSAKF